MLCCTNCFESSYINEIIINNQTTGTCDFCKSQNVYTYEPSKLNTFLVGLIDLYEIDKAKGLPLEEQIVLDFHKKIFSEKLIETGNIKELVARIIIDSASDYRPIMENPVRLRFRNSEMEKEISLPLFHSWDSFSEEIKTVNRFHFVNALDLEKLKSLFKHFQKDYQKGKEFYRARICEKSQGFAISEMGNPPTALAKSGRANPNGISYLYVANDITTTLYEARASLYDLVSVGVFKLEQDISVVNLSRSTYDVFRLAEIESLEEVMIHGTFTDRLEDELSKPRRKTDSELDYLPSQYLSELIKSMGFDGIEYKSSLHSKGQNIAIFRPEKVKCIEVNTYEIEDIKLQYRKLPLS